MRERLEEDTAFVLSVSRADTAGLTSEELEAEDEIDVQIDTIDNDVAVTADQLAHQIGLGGTPEQSEDHSVALDGIDNTVYLAGGVDAEIVEDGEPSNDEESDSQLDFPDQPGDVTKIVLFPVEDRLQDLWHLDYPVEDFDYQGEDSVMLDGTAGTRYVRMFL